MQITASSSIPSTMQAMTLVGHGDIDMLKLTLDTPVPTPLDYQVLIKVSAAGVNNTDINTRTAWYSKSTADSKDASWSGQALTFPRIQGADVCGEIVAVGKHVNPQRIGQRVLIEPCITHANGKQLASPWYFGSECDGGFAQYTTVDAVHAYAINSALSDIELASFPCSYSTAENMLTKANVSQQERVLITGASGGVGSAAVQLAKARGAFVIAITSREKREQLLSIGADQVIDRSDNLLTVLASNSVDVVIDLVAGKQWPQLLELLRPGGRYAVAGAIGGAMVNLDVRTLYLKDLSLLGCTVLQAGVFQALIKHIEQSNIKPLVAEVYALKEIPAAQASFSQKQHVGKIVIDIK